MKTAKIPVYNQQGKEVKKLDLDPSVFDGTVNQAVLYQAVVMYRANRRKGLASTKTRGEVSGGGTKPWRQKGTGRARVGSIRTPLWRKGGVVFGPHPREYGFNLPKKIRNLALKSSLNAKFNDNNLVILDDLKIDAPKTKQAVAILSKLRLSHKSKGPKNKKPAFTALLMLVDMNENLKRSFRNIGTLEMGRASNINAYDVLKVQKLIVTLSGLNILISRIKGTK